MEMSMVKHPEGNDTAAAAAAATWSLRHCRSLAVWSRVPCDALSENKLTFNRHTAWLQCYYRAQCLSLQ